MIGLLLPWHMNLSIPSDIEHHDAPEERALSVAAESRAFFPLDARGLPVAAESRSLAVDADARALEVEAENRRLS